MTAQPTVEEETAQSSLDTVPDMPVPEILQLSAVWSTIVSAVFWLTPSMISISPFVGQVPEPNDQNAGHEPQTLAGICAISAINRPCV